MYRFTSDGPYSPEFIQGWINVFNPYIKSYDSNEFDKTTYMCKAGLAQNSNIDWKNNESKGISPSEVIDGLSKCPMKFKVQGHKEIDTMFYGGFIGARMNDDGSIQSECGWAVIVSDQ